MYAKRRQRVMEAMGSGSLAIWLSPPTSLRNGDSEYLYRASSDLLYLTGCQEPDVALVLRPGAKGEESVLFVRPRDPQAEIWTGRRIGPERAAARFAVDRSYPIEALEEKVASWLVGVDRLFVRMGQFLAHDQQVLAWLEKARKQRKIGKKSPNKILDTSDILHEMRLLKEEEEIVWMQQAADVTASGHAAAMRACKPGMHEYELEATLGYHFRKAGATGMAYNPIVGGGENATILHYNENCDPLRDGDLVLIDAGAEIHYYAADITRTFPINGRFSPRQREIYQIVLEAELAAIEACVVGRRFNDIHATALRIMTEGLRDLGLLQGEVDHLLETEAYKPFAVHKTSHWLGLDVHDTGSYFEADGQSRILQPGMILTVEPGLYFYPWTDNPKAEPYHGIGIRIEDNVLITPQGPVNLTRKAPKTIEEIEAIVGSDPRP